MPAIYYTAISFSLLLLERANLSYWRLHKDVLSVFAITYEFQTILLPNQDSIRSETQATFVNSNFSLYFKVFYETLRIQLKVPFLFVTIPIFL